MYSVHDVFHGLNVSNHLPSDRPREQKPEPGGPLPQVHQEVARLPGSLGPGRMGGDAQDVHGPGGLLSQEERQAVLRGAD